jgi:hypothetical protein
LFQILTLEHLLQNNWDKIMTKKKYSRYGYLMNKLKKLEKEYENTNEKAVLKRSRLEKKGLKIEEELEELRKSFY